MLLTLAVAVGLALAKAGTTANEVQLLIEMQVDASGQISGVIQGIAAEGSPSTPPTQQV